MTNKQYDIFSLKKYKYPAQQGREFVEFYVNDKPLSILLDGFYQLATSILENWIGVLGSFADRTAELIKVRQLMGKPIADKEIRKLYAKDENDPKPEYYITELQEELSGPGTRLYCCAQCGGYDCGGLEAVIGKTEDSFTWTFSEGNRKLVFEFNKYQYFDVLNGYLNKLQKLIHSKK